MKLNEFRLEGCMGSIAAVAAGIGFHFLGFNDELTRVYWAAHGAAAGILGSLAGFLVAAAVFVMGHAGMGGFRFAASQCTLGPAISCLMNGAALLAIAMVWGFAAPMLALTLPSYILFAISVGFLLGVTIRLSRVWKCLCDLRDAIVAQAELDAKTARDARRRLEDAAFEADRKNEALSSGNGPCGE